MKGAAEGATNRCIAFSSVEGVFLQSRQQRPLGRYFPEIAVGLAEQVPAGTVLDGKLVVNREGRPYWACREHLERLLRRAAPPLALMPATRDLAGRGPG